MAAKSSQIWAKMLRIWARLMPLPCSKPVTSLWDQASIMASVSPWLTSYGRTWLATLTMMSPYIMA